jgi:hypothetical protein
LETHIVVILKHQQAKGKRLTLGSRMWRFIKANFFLTVGLTRILIDFETKQLMEGSDIFKVLRFEWF